MPPLTAFATFFITWWTVLFCVLPFGARSQTDDGHVEAGTDPGAPTHFNLRRVVKITTLASLAVWGVIFIAAQFHLVTVPRFVWNG
jgi:predicted secreted protein